MKISKKNLIYFLKYTVFSIKFKDSQNTIYYISNIIHNYKNSKDPDDLPSIGIEFNWSKEDNNPYSTTLNLREFVRLVEDYGTEIKII